MSKHYVISESKHDLANPSDLIDLRLSPADAMRLAMNLLAGVQAGVENGHTYEVRVSFVGKVETKEG